MMGHRHPVSTLVILLGWLAMASVALARDASGGFGATLAEGESAPLGDAMFERFGRHETSLLELATRGARGEPSDTRQNLTATAPANLGTDWVQRDKLRPADGTDGVFDGFGWASALQGDTALVLACEAPAGSSVYVYSRSDDIWTQEAKLTPFDRQTCGGLIFGGDVAVDGDTALVGLPATDGTPDPLEINGSVVVYTRSGGEWVQQATITAPTSEVALDFFGWSVDLFGDTAFISAFNTDAGGNPIAPSVYVYTRFGEDWILQQTLLPTGPPEQSLFGWNVALDGDTAAITDFDSVEGAGKVDVFVHTDGAWDRQTELTPSDGAPGLDFGLGGLALEGDTVLVGANRRTFDDISSVYVYARSDGEWAEQIKITDPTEDGNFGRALAIQGDTALVGDREQDRAYVYVHQQEEWGLHATLAAADEAAATDFGQSVGLDADTVLVSHYPLGIFGSSNGWAYVFDTRDPAPTAGLWPLSVDFGEVRVGEVSVAHAATVQNNGAAELSVGTLALSGDAAGDFRLEVDGCSGQSLPPGATCTIDLTFAPSAEEAREAGVDVPTNAPTSPDHLPLHGTGLPGPPKIQLTPDHLEVVLGEGETSDESLIITNLGTFDLEWQIVDESGSGLALTHSASLDIEVPHTPRCVANDEQSTLGNKFLRTFALEDFGIFGDLEITEVSFGVEELTATASITVNLYTLEGDFVFENLTLIGSTTSELTAQQGTLVTVPVTGFIPAGSTLVVEIDAPSLADIPAFFTAGSNSAGETAPSYLAAPGPENCDINQPTTMADIGFPDAHLVMTVTGSVECVVPEWLGVTPTAGTVPGRGEETVTVTFDATGLPPGEREALLCVASNDVGRPLVQLPAGLTVIEGVTEFIATALEVDAQAFVSDGNGVFEPGEQTEVAPTWRNDGTVSHDLGGAASAFAGPEGAEYTIAESAAAYGLIGPGQSASCRDTGLCYRMDVSDPSARPAAHWDAVFEETLDDAGGTARSWVLHIGDSFADVERGSLFYSWIETLLHHGVTGGCTATQYCPSGPNTRGQMAVFLLKAAEDGGYVPPACVEGEEAFADVPADDIFCPWIEELAGRGVTAGCGGGNYCPNASVSRDQMAVFLLKTLLGAGYVPPACTGVFADVPCPSLFADWIEDLVARGITAGCGGGNYCPGNLVSRDQMAVFLAKTFGLTLYGP